MKINAESDAEWAQQLAALGVRDEDIEESFVRSGGHGGQNVNKTSTCVMLIHRPTGVRVKCQETRHQGRNRLLARKLLLEKLGARRLAKEATARANNERIRRQRRPRSRASQERILASKSKRAAKKKSRRSFDSD